MTPPLAYVEWKPSWRIIPSRFPPIQLFEDVSAPEDLDALFMVEAMTNPRLREEAGNIQLVTPEDRVVGSGASVIMAAFTHPNPLGSRFSDGTYGVFYCAEDLNTAIAETKHHRERFLSATKESRLEIDMRVYRTDLEGDLHDLRGQERAHPPVYDPENHAAGQKLGRRLRLDGANGIVYSSVRRVGGECAAVFRPPLLSNVRQANHLCYVWDGSAISAIYEKRALSGSESQ